MSIADTHLLDRLQSRCTSDSLKLDIGANIGGYTHLMLSHPGDIHAFEPIPQLAKPLAERFSREPRVQVYPLGCSDRIYIESGLVVCEVWTLDTPERARRGRNADFIAQHGADPITCSFTTVDHHLARKGRKVDFMKIDTDGFEYRVLKGAERTLLTHRPPLYIEFNYMVTDVGDDDHALCELLFTRCRYLVLTERGELTDAAYWDTHWPRDTTFDVGAVPVERLAEFGLADLPVLSA